MVEVLTLGVEKRVNCLLEIIVRVQYNIILNSHWRLQYTRMCTKKSPRLNANKPLPSLPDIKNQKPSYLLYRREPPSTHLKLNTSTTKIKNFATTLSIFQSIIML